MPAKAKRKREPKTNAENYLKLVPAMESKFLRFPEVGIAAAWELANMYWTFGDFDSAGRWYEKSVPLIREQAGSKALVMVAFTYWKAGLPEKMSEECRGVIASRQGELPTLEAAYNEAPVKKDEVRRPLLLACDDLAFAYFLLDSHREARQWGEKAAALMHTRGPSTPDAVAALAGALERGSAEDYEKALRLLRGILRPWPTFMSDSGLDLYRRALALAKERFGSIPVDLVEDELRGSLFGPPVVKRKRRNARA